MAIQTQGTSAHFVYRWDDTVNGAQQRAAALQSTCESDLAKLEALFDEFNGFDNNIVTLIVGDPGSGALASNTNYRSDGTTTITTTAWSGVNPAATADLGVRLEFIAEMCEVVMGLRNSRKGATSWNPGGSNGEGLSQYLAEMFYRTGYYDAQLGHGPGRVTKWLNDPTRPDWVTTTEGTDRNATSYGCAFLFLHFLHTQKGYSVKDIITKGGADLETTYRNLTGSNGGWTEFVGLLNRFYPTRDGAGNAVTYAPGRCNIFPLYDDQRRSVDVTDDEVPGFPVRTPGDSIVSISPGVLCPVGQYSWSWLDPNGHLVLTARPRGFGNPVVTWVVDGSVVPNPGGTISVTGPVDLDQAAQPGHPARSTQTFHLSTSTQFANDVNGPVSTLTLVPAEHPGTEQLTVEVRVTEQFAGGVPQLTETTWTTLHTHGVEYEPRYYQDQEACRAKWADFVKRHVHVKVVNILLTLPDPGPDELIRIARMVEEVQRELGRVAEREPEAARQLGQELARVLGVGPRVLLPGQRSGGEQLG